MLINLATLALWCVVAQEPAKDSLVLATLEGNVSDPDGKPIADALVVLNGTKGYAQTRGGTEATGRGKTDANGMYKLSIYTKPDGLVTVTKILAEAKGFVNFREEFWFEELLLRPRQVSRWDFVLARGE